MQRLIPLRFLRATCAPAFGLLLGDPSPAYLKGQAADPHSFSNPADVRVTHVDLDLDLDFEARVVQGTATLLLDRLRAGEPLILDTQGLTIESVAGEDGELLPFDLGEERERFGQALKIKLRGRDNQVAIRYRTRPGAEALQWLEPAQTTDGVAPFLYTQGQAVLTRTWIPCKTPRACG